MSAHVEIEKRVSPHRLRDGCAADLGDSPIDHRRELIDHHQRPRIDQCPGQGRAELLAVGQLAGDVEQVPGLDVGHIVGHRLGGWGGTRYN